MARIESALLELLIAHRGPVATGLLHWLLTGEHVHGALCVDIGWLPPGAPDPFT